MRLCGDLQVCENAVKIYKGTNPDVDSYSAFWDNSKLTDTKLEAQLRSRNVTDVFVCGLAYDVCVGERINWREERGRCLKGVFCRIDGD